MLADDNRPNKRLTIWSALPSESKGNCILGLVKFKKALMKILSVNFHR